MVIQTITTNILIQNFIFTVITNIFNMITLAMITMLYNHHSQIYIPQSICQELFFYPIDFSLFSNFFKAFTAKSDIALAAFLVASDLKSSEV